MIKVDKGYEKHIGKLLRIDKILYAENVFERKNLLDILENYTEKRLYKEDQEEFKNIFFANIFNFNRKINVRHRGIGCINSILEEDQLPFRLTSIQDRKGVGRGKRYWFLIKP